MKFDVLIAGGGFAGVYCAKALSSVIGHNSIKRVGLLADQNIMVFQPMLAEVAAAALSPLDVVNPLREMCPCANVLLGTISDIDLKERRVILDAGRFTANVSIEFEHLVLAMGGVVDLSRAPGMAEHGFVLKNVGDAMQLRQALISRLEEAQLAEDEITTRRLLTFAIVGGGYSGVETAGQILDLIQDVKPLYHNLANQPVRVILIHSGSFLLPEIGEKLGNYATDQLRRRGMEIRLNSRVTAVTSSKLFLQDGQTIDSHTVVSTVGNAPHPLLTKLSNKYGLEVINGRIVTEPSMKVKGQEKLWAIGDCAAIPLEGKPSCPPTAQFALRQGTQLGKNIAREMKGQPLKPFQFKNLGQLASIGHRTAVAEVLGFKFSGLLAWWFWRTVYLFKLPGFQRKFGVVFNWTLELFFKRNISVFVPQCSELLPEIHLEKGDVLFAAGEAALSFYIITSGNLELSRDEKVVGVVKSGEHFGDWALGESGRWLCTAIALKPTKLVRINRKTYKLIASASDAFCKVPFAHDEPIHLS